MIFQPTLTCSASRPAEVQVTPRNNHTGLRGRLRSGLQCDDYCLAPTASLFSSLICAGFGGGGTFGHGFFNASCIITIQFLGPLTAPKHKSQQIPPSKQVP